MSFNQWQYYTAADNETLAAEQIVVTTLNLPLLGALNVPAVISIGQFFPAFVLTPIGYTSACCVCAAAVAAAAATSTQLLPALSCR